MSNVIAGGVYPPLIPPAAVGATAPASKETGFGDVLRSAIGQAEDLRTDADQQVTGLLQGDRSDVHNVMIAVEKADVAFQLMMQVMQHLENINEVGKGIAVAFVATIYGVGSANILFLPFAGKLKLRLREQQLIREMTLEGVISILEGLNPRAIESKLQSYVSERRERAGPRPLQRTGKVVEL